MSEDGANLPVNKDPSLLRQMLKKVSGKNQKLKEELNKLLEANNNNLLVLKSKDEAIEKAEVLLTSLRDKMKENEQEINAKNEKVNTLQKEISKLNDKIKAFQESNENAIKSQELEQKLKQFEKDKLTFEEQKKKIIQELQIRKENIDNEVKQNIKEKEKVLNDRFNILAAEQHKFEVQKSVIEEMKQKYFEETAQLENKRIDVEVEIETTNAKLDEIRKERHKNEQILQDILEERKKNEEILLNSQDELKSIEEKKRTLEEQLKDFESRAEEIKAFEESKKDMENKLEDIKKREQNVEAIKQSYESKVIDVELLHLTLQAKVRSTEMAREEAQNKLDQLLVREEQVDDKISKMVAQEQRQRMDAEAMIKSLQKKIEEVCQQNSEANNRLHEITDLYSTLKSQTDSINKAKEDYEKQYNDMKTKFENANLPELLATANKYKEVTESNENFKNEISKLKEDIKTLEMKNEATEKKLTAEIARYDASTKGHIDGIHASYLKKSLLQFFFADNNKQRESMIPMILDILSCDDNQVQHAMKNWRESQQIINKGI